jgi:hypothetical protein
MGSKLSSILFGDRFINQQELNTISFYIGNEIYGQDFDLSRIRINDNTRFSRAYSIITGTMQVNGSDSNLVHEAFHQVQYQIDGLYAQAHLGIEQGCYSAQRNIAFLNDWGFLNPYDYDNSGGQGTNFANGNINYESLYDFTTYESQAQFMTNFVKSYKDWEKDRDNSTLYNRARRHADVLTRSGMSSDAIDNLKYHNNRFNDFIWIKQRSG